MKPAWYIISIIFLLLCQTAAAQNPGTARYKRCPVKTINYESGLTNNGVTAIITDRRGFTWVSTLTGVQRYNGYFLQNITPIAGKDTFHIKYPVYFFELNDGSMWLSLKQTVLKYDPVSNSFSVVISLSSAGNALLTIIPLKETAAGIWCLQEGKGLVIYNRMGKLVKQLSLIQTTVADKILNSMGLLYLNKMAINSNHIFINETGSNNNYTSVNNNKGSLLAINTEKNQIQQINLPDSNVLGLCCRGDKLCVLSNNKLFFINSDDYTINRQVPLTSFFSEKVLSGSLRFTGSGALLVAVNNHLFELDPEEENMVELTNLNREPAVAAGFIHQLYPDKFGRIWMITNNDIKRIEDIEMPFEHFIYPAEKNNFIRSVYCDPQKNVVIACCFYSGIQLYDTSGNPLLKKIISFPSLTNILSIEKLTPGEYLLTTFRNGWYHFNLSTRTIKPFKIPEAIKAILQPSQVNFTNNIQRAGGDTFIIATASNIFRCRISGTELLSAEPMLTDEEKFKGVIMSCLYDSHKNIWAGTYKGEVIRIDQNKKNTVFPLPDKYGLRSLTEDAAHHIWAGTEKGLYVLNQEGKLLNEFNIETGLRNDCIYALLPSDTGSSVYASSNLGISYISLNGKVKNFTKEMGLQENEFNTNAAFKSANGKFYFGGINGITAFYPSSLSTIKDSPFLYVTRLVVNDSLYNHSAGIWTGDSILLSYNQNRLRFDIAAIGLLNSNEYVYQYRLKGFEETWQTTYLPTGINYTLNPGEYHLEITCYPVFSSEISFSKTFVIIIYPPFWQTWWFRILAGIALMGMMAFILQQYNRRKYQRQIQSLQVQHELQQERERISRELHDDIGTKVNMLAYNVSQLGGIQAGEALEKMKERMKDTSDDMLQSLKETVWTLKQESITTEDVWFRFKNFIVKLQQTFALIQFQVVEEEGQTDKKINYNEALNLIRILQEAVNNAIRHSGCNIIHCSKKNENELLVFTVTDDGKGFEEAPPGNMNKGNGLDNMKHRAKESGFSFLMNSIVNKGTSVVIKA